MNEDILAAAVRRVAHNDMVNMVVRLGAAGSMGCRVLALLLPKAPWPLVANCSTDEEKAHS